MKCKTKFQFSLGIHILYVVNKCNKAICVGRKCINKSLEESTIFKDQWSRMCCMWIFYMNSWIKMHLTSSYPRCIYYWRRDAVMKSPLTVLSFLSYENKIVALLPCLCTKICHRWCLNVVRTLAAPQVPFFCSWNMFYIICDLLLKRDMVTFVLF